MLMLLIFSLWLFFLNGAGRTDTSFDAQTIDSTVSIGYGLTIGDVDGDKKPDIILADKKAFVWYRNGDWKKFVLAENLTESDNVCIAAKDVDGDGRVEIAVGAQWNPSETSDEARSGAVYFLVRPEDPTKAWKAVQLYHEPTIHRMRWIESGGVHYLAVLPLHGKGNKGGEGQPVNLLLFQYPQLQSQPAPLAKLVTGMHLTHNLEVAPANKQVMAGVFVAGKEGIGLLRGSLTTPTINILKLPSFEGAGELRLGKLDGAKSFITTIEPMHGNKLVVYAGNQNQRQVLDTMLKEGHALAAADILGLGYDQVVAGWRVKNGEGKVGIKLYSKDASTNGAWKGQWIDDNEMACEDLQVADLDGDGKLDIIAAGRATHNLKIYWNKGTQK